MHILVGLLAVIGGIVFWVYRARMAATAASDLADMAGTVMGAARRFGFRRRHDMHPVDCIDDTTLAAGALTVAFLDLGQTQTEEMRRTHILALQKHFVIGKDEAEELLVMGHWLVNECSGPAPAVTRLGKRLMKLTGSHALDAPLQVINDVAGASGGLTDSQRDALHDLQRIFRR
ncbi:hypothetical protein [Hasllibacter sp. MH4015]|uniref:hypothetical protein n=1 Tax=Hasllibacter sp. MH4015 TaxID=2854029 RepID=UPI001CD40A93|nr:hypothetical protein [Hasllibacter sp. MH4015]